MYAKKTFIADVAVPLDYNHVCMFRFTENVRESKSLNNNVYIALDKMEALQNAVNNFRHFF